MLLPKLKNNFFFFLLGCGVTSVYFWLINYSPATLVQWKYANLSWNSQYGNIKSRQVENQDAVMEERYPDGWNDNNYKLDSLFTCDNSLKYKTFSQRGNFYVIYNFVKAKKDFGCTESVTLTAPGDFRFLDNIVPLADRWQGPISIALYAPGHDFYTTIKSIAYLRQCQSDSIKDFVSFHLFFDIGHIPETRNQTTLINSYQDSYNCSMPPPWRTVKNEDIYKAQKKLLYPINFARNVAREASNTFIVFPNDIELYPSRRFIPLFLNFVKGNINLFKSDSRNVFVFPVFEIMENQRIPENKTELLEMLKKKTAIVFHQNMCIQCHRVIDSEKWIETAETKGLGVFSFGKRQGIYKKWEPFFVCTQKEPLFDERFTWEGQEDKFVQAYTLCVMDYDFHIFDNAFLVHKPGIKKKREQMQKYRNEVSKSKKLKTTIAQEIQEIYGRTEGCSI